MGSFEAGAVGHLLSQFGFALPEEQWLLRLREADQPPAPGRVGPFELLGEARSGAQGVVYRARQPNTNRVIALKRLARRLQDEPAAVARFEREMEAAVSLCHPNIVTVYGYELVEGRPLMAMEWIEGRAIDLWAHEAVAGRPRPVASILRLFARLCDAVHHAHQRGVIHRDLKPSNILVDAADEPHVLDFGVAKLARPALAVRLTGGGDFLGTPAYAAPEQVRGEHDAVDVRTDVYALGVVLFEMLTARLPFEPGGDFAALFDAIRDRDPPRPSALRRELDGDLDAITLTSLSKQPSRRYASVDALAADVRRHLAGEPLEARRGQRGYLLRKMLRRYRTIVLTSGAFVLLTSGAALTIGLLYARQSEVLAQVAAARDSEAAARKDAQRALAALDRLLSQVAELGKGVDAGLRREMVAQAARATETELSDSPAAWATACDAIGGAYRRLALYDDAERYLRLALEQRIALHGREHVDTAASISHLAKLLQDRTRYAEAEPLYVEALAIRRRLLGPEHRDVAASLHDVGVAQFNRQDFEGALRTHEQALAMRRHLLGERHPDTLRSLDALAYALINLGRNEEGESRLRAVLQMRSEEFGAESIEAAGSHVSLGKVLMAQGRLDEAEPALRRGLGLYRRLLGERHDNVAWAAHRLGNLLHARGELQEAEALLREAHDTYCAVLGPDDPFVGYVCESLAALLVDAGALDEARRFQERADAIRAAEPR